VAKHWLEANWKKENKWWDGYRGEPEVVLDDLGSAHLFELLKRWADRYKVIGEVKGGAVDLSYETFVITSNFTPHELSQQGFEVPEATIAAIQRRFVLVEAIEWDPVEDDLVILPINQEAFEPLPFQLGSYLDSCPRMYLGNLIKAYYG